MRTRCRGMRLTATVMGCEPAGCYRGVLRAWLALLAICPVVAGEAVCAPQPADVPRAQQETVSVTVAAGPRPMLEYRRLASPRKPYVRQLYTPSGVPVLRDEPPDHRHHHALMFALAADGVNFWEERDGGGTQQPRSLKLLQGRSQKGLKGAGLQQQIDWLAPPDGRRLLRERRTIEVFASAEPAATILLWRSRLEVADRQPQVVLGGSHYVGLGVRFLASMDRGGRFFNADKKEGDSIRNTERLTQTRWCAYTAEANGRPVTLAFFDHPGNVRHPSRMFTMTSPFAYLAATLNLWKEPLSMASGDALELVYSVVVLDGEASWETIEALYHRWCK